jgi:hypothetical protein
MRCWTLRGQLRAAVVVLTILIVAFLATKLLEHSWWRWKGRADAERDIVAGKMKWKGYGPEASLLHQRCDGVAQVLAQYELELEVAAGSKVIIKERTRNYIEVKPGWEVRTNAYNDRIAEELDRKFGAGTAEQIRLNIRAQDSQGLVYGCPLP